MKLTDRMLYETKKYNQQKKKENDIQQDQDEDETGMAYMPRPDLVFLNENKGVFANDDNSSINTAKSVFDRTALFHTESVVPENPYQIKRTPYQTDDPDYSNGHL